MHEDNVKGSPAETPKIMAAENGEGSLIGHAARLAARAIIQDRAIDLEREAAGLRALLDALPLRMPPQADQALWSMVIRAK